MTTPDDKTREIFAEAVGLRSQYAIPYSISKLIALLSDFAKEWGLEWNIGDGESKKFSVWICHCASDMYVEVEDSALSDAVMLSVTVAYLNMKNRPSGKVISLNEWKMTNRR